MQIGSKNHLKMLLATLSAPNRGQVRSRVLRPDKTTTILLPNRPFGQKMSLQGRIMGPIWELKWLQKRDFDARLALGPSKNEFLGVVLENVRNLMKFLCENA